MTMAAEQYEEVFGERYRCFWNQRTNRFEEVDLRELFRHHGHGAFNLSQIQQQKAAAYATAYAAWRRSRHALYLICALFIGIAGGIVYVQGAALSWGATALLCIIGATLVGKVHENTPAGLLLPT